MHSGHWDDVQSELCGVQHAQEDVLAAEKANDVWACGTVLYAMLTARPPWHAHVTTRCQAETSSRVSECGEGGEEGQRRLQWPSHLRLSDNCKNLLEAMLSPNVAERPGIHQVLDHPWYMQDLPRELQV
jgi:serine/threonine protein kinase